MTLTSTISGTHTTAINLTSATYANPVTVTGTITAGLFTSYAWSIANSGIIQGPVDGIDVTDPSAVVIVSNSGRITGASRGIAFSTGTITNQSGGYIDGAGIAGIYAKYHQGATATITNAGTIKGADGVLLHVPGQVTNAAGGTIDGGVYFAKGAHTLANAGSIGVGSGGTYAVNFGSGDYANRLILTPGETMGGSVYAPNSGNTLELTTGTGTGTIADLGGSYGNFDVTIDAGARWSFGGGEAGTPIIDSGTLTTTGVGDTAQLTLTNGGVLINPGGNRDNGGLQGIGGATLENYGTLKGNVAFAAGAANKVVVGPAGYFTGGTVDGGNTLGASIASTLEMASGAGTGTLSGLGSKYIDFSRVEIDAGATWELAATNTLGAGGTLTNNGVLLDADALGVQTLVGTGAVTIGSNAALSAGGVVASGQTIRMTGTSDVLDIGGKSSFAGTIKSFGTTGIIDVAGIGFAQSGNVSGDALSLYSGINHTGTKLFTFPDITNGSGGAVNLATLRLVRDGDGGTVVACYLRGTRIRTARGEMAVEGLSVGDLVVTAAGRLEPIRWVGRRRYVLARTEGHEVVLPVLIRAGAIGDGLPRRDLNVSPEHALLLDGMLVPARHLTNGKSMLRRRDLDMVEYFHVELASHAAIFAEGLHAETFVDCDTRGLFDNAHTYTGGGAPGWRFCAPRVEEGEALEAIRRRVNARAGIAIGDEPGKLTGNLERATGGVVEGWAQDAAAPERPVRLEILADGVPAAVVLANRYRGDLEAAGLGSGRHAFRVALRGAARRVEARRVEDGARLGVVEEK